MAIATVMNVKGEVFAVNKEGVKRRLQKGDQLQEGEILVTAPGSSAELDMGGGKTVTVAEQQTFAVDGSVGGPAQPSAATSAIESAAAAQKVVQALASGDVNALLEAEAAAAGLAGGGATDGGSSFVQLLRISEGVTGVGYEFGSPVQGGPLPDAAGGSVVEEITISANEPVTLLRNDSLRQLSEDSPSPSSGGNNNSGGETSAGGNEISALVLNSLPSVDLPPENPPQDVPPSDTLPVDLPPGSPPGDLPPDNPPQDTPPVDPPTQPAGDSVLNASIWTNTSRVPRSMLFTFADENNSENVFRMVLELVTGGQKNEILLREDVGFVIDPDGEYTVTLSYVDGGKIIVTDMEVEGVDLLDTKDGVHINDTDKGADVHGVSVTFQPSHPESVDVTLIDYDFVGTDTKGNSDGADSASGGSGADIMSGLGGNDTLSGGGGDDFLIGGAGDDVLSGGLGNDILSGGQGNDTFVWTPDDLTGIAGSPAVDIIADFGNGTDRILLKDLLSGADADNLAQYLHFEYNPAINTTILNVSTQGNDVVDQQIVLANYDVTPLGENDAQIIASMLGSTLIIE